MVLHRIRLLKMQKLLYILVFSTGLYGHAQTALYNSGSIRIHDQGQLGFHTNLINDSTFDENLGLAGFYGTTTLTVSGAFEPIFFDVEIANNNHLLLQTGINTINNTNFIIGNITTPRNQTNIFYNFLQDAFYVGEGDISKVDGYVTITDQQNFTFPVGDEQQLRPLILNSDSANTLAKCAYFLENPNNPSTFNTSFDTEKKPRNLGAISTLEFWRLEGTIPSTISISWNERSDMAAMTDDVNTIIPVGWSKSSSQWVNLGGSAIGDLSQGFVTSFSFVPDDYEIITLGNLGVPTELLTLENYFISPNGDGTNDFLIIPELEQSPNNTLRVYDRHGLKVFQMDNYTNEFNGFSNIDNFVINRKKGLPAGVYFYIVSMDDLDLNFQGFLYLAR